MQHIPMNSSSKRKLEQQQEQQQSGLDKLKVPVEWVDDHERNTIQSAFDALSKVSGVVESSRTVISSSSTTPPLSMVPSTLSPSSSATAAICHWSCHSPTTVQSYSCWNIPQSLKQREYHCRTRTCRPNNGEGGSPWKIMGLVPCQLSTRNISLGGGFIILWRQSPNNACSECFLDENTILAKERTEERAEIDSRPSESLGESCQPSSEILHSGMAVGSGRSNVEKTLFEAIGPDVEDRGGRELSNKKSARRLPAWMMNPAKQWLLPAESASCVVEQREQIRALSGVGGVLVSKNLVQEEETRSAIVEQVNVASVPQQTENGHPPFHVQQPQVGRKWGLQPASFVDDLKPKFPTMQFRGQIVYSKTKSEVSAATEELWRRVHELQEKAQGAIPIGFDLEWKASFEKGPIAGPHDLSPYAQL